MIALFIVLAAIAVPITLLLIFGRRISRPKGAEATSRRISIPADPERGILEGGWIDADLKEQADRWREENPPGPPSTAAQRATFARGVEALALPSIQLEATDAEIGPSGTRVGGPAWLPDGEAWPVGRNGQPMEFLAQVDFGDLPALPDYPTTGLLQFFIARDDHYGGEFDNPTASDFKAIWRPDPLNGGTLHSQFALSDPLDPTPFEDDDVRAEGQALVGEQASRLPSHDSLPVETLLAELGLERAADIDDLLEPLWSAEEPANLFVGGHPRFVQWDFRRPDALQDYDRVLLQLDSSSGLMWGDVGYAVFMIRRADLLARNFARVAYTWDCS